MNSLDVRDRSWHHRNKEHVSAYNRAYNQKNRKRINIRKRIRRLVKKMDKAPMEIANTTFLLEQLIRMGLAVNNMMAETKKLKSQIYQMEQNLNALNRLRLVQESQCAQQVKRNGWD